VTLNTKTGQELLTGLGEFIDDDHSSTTTGAGNAAGTSLTDTSQSDFGERAMVDGWIRITSGTNDGEVRRVTVNDGSATITVAPAFTAQVATSVTYEFHRWNPDAKLKALDRARFSGFPYISTVVEDATQIGDNYNRKFSFAGTLKSGPYTCWQELELGTTHTWNVLKNPRGTSLTGWDLSGAGATATLYQGGDYDRIIPKYTTVCTRITVPITTAVSYSQLASQFTSLTVTNAAGRKVTFGKWIYAKLADRVTLMITDDAGTSSSVAHQGRGWEYLEVSRDVDGDNSATLTVSTEISSGAVMTVWWNHAWFVLGDMPDVFSTQITPIRVQRDGSQQVVYLDEAPMKGLQLKLIGRGHLSALNEDVTATMEVDDGMAETLYAYAAQVLFTDTGMSSEDSGELAQKIQTVLTRLRKSKTFFDSEIANPPGMNTPHGI
jgi:hypothetical protein